ncbi:hypothetical protein [Lysinibacillus xylanilyticus]|uniref:hypothetical protein n=1 Tax=Lysinibacillus xylanilyticus TaxID=582475 RepID=UPI003D9994F0
MKPETTFLTKNVVWNIDGKQYVVENVPYSELKAEENEYFDMDVSIRLTMLRDLIFMEEIPSKIDYSIVANFEV